MHLQLLRLQQQPLLRVQHYVSWLQTPCLVSWQLGCCCLPEGAPRGLMPPACCWLALQQALHLLCPSADARTKCTLQEQHTVHSAHTAYWLGSECTRRDHQRGHSCTRERQHARLMAVCFSRVM